MLRRPATYLLAAVLGLPASTWAQTPLSLTDAIARARTRNPDAGSAAAEERAPFALQPPFTTGDLYDQFKIVERPPVYCCPPDQWWAARKATLMALMESPTPQPVASIVFDRENHGTPTFTIRTVDGRALKQRIESVLGKPLDGLTTVNPAEAQEISRLLFE